MPRSLIVFGTACGIPRPPPIFYAHGAPDDHHRLIVLLADRVQDVVGREDDAVRVCRDRRTVWSDRLAAFQRALESGRDHSKEPYTFGIADLDVLAAPDQGNWDERAVFKERQDFYRVLLRAIDRSGWVVVRPDPSEPVSNQLDELDVDSTIADAPAGPAGLPPEMLGLLAPDLRPVAAWLHRIRALSPERLDDIVEEVSDVGEHLLNLAYDALPRRARDAGKLLSAVRQPQRVNHSLGQFAIGDGEPGPTSLPQAAVDALRDAGFLQPHLDGSPSMLRMPRRVRVLLEGQAALSLPGETREVHARLANALEPSVLLETRLETPFHALRSGDVETAKRTAFFSGDLRDFAARLSRRADGRPEDWAHAAALFQYLIDTFDPKDAFAHEYLGYNLARSAGTREKERVLRAYELAHRYANEKNPLYHGRLVGFRAELGQDIVADFDRGMRVYSNGRSSAVAYFAEAVFNGLARGQRDETRARLFQKWGPTLKRLAPRVTPS